MLFLLLASWLINGQDDSSSTRSLIGQDDPLVRDVDDADMNQRLDDAIERGWGGGSATEAPPPAPTIADGGAIGWVPSGDAAAPIRATLRVPAGACIIGLAWAQRGGGGSSMILFIQPPPPPPRSLSCGTFAGTVNTIRLASFRAPGYVDSERERSV